nr:hypothetical protein [Tanacetum cinerariifolium]
MQHQLQELMDLCTSLQRQQTQMAAKIKDQDLDISDLKERVKSLKDKDRGAKDKGKEKVVKSEVPKKRKLQEQIDAQVAKEMEEEFARENQRVKYQDHHTKILKYQAQQSKPLSKKEQREFYMSVLRSHAGWKTKHFRGMSLEEIKEKFIPVWKQLEDFVPMSSKEEG